MIKTLRKVWKSDWGKAALVGVGLVGYGAFSSAGHVANINKTLRSAPSRVGFLADIQDVAADIITAPIEFGQVLSTSGYGYLAGKNDWSTFKGGVQSAFGMFGDPKNYGTLGKIGKNIYDARMRQKGQPGSGGGDRIRHRPVQSIDSGGYSQIQKAGQWSEFDPQRLANNTLNYARQKRDLYGNIVSQANGVSRQGPNLSIKEAQITSTKPAYRYTTA